jgi:ATP-dependent DNA helicase RecG
VPASEERIRKMIKDTDGDKYIAMRSTERELTFNAAEDEFEKAGIKFGEEQQVTLGIKDSGLQYTNLGLLLSDQCRHTIKVAVFEGNTKSVFKSRKEFEGSLFKQLNNALDYIDYFNLIHAEIGMKKRVERLSYSRESIREAVLNAAIHREYAFSGSTLINVYDNRIEVASLGGLVSGMMLDAAIKGVSRTRNERLAKVFYKLEWVEAYGTEA